MQATTTQKAWISDATSRSRSRDRALKNRSKSCASRVGSLFRSATESTGRPSRLKASDSTERASAFDSCARTRFQAVTYYHIVIDTRQWRYRFLIGPSVVTRRYEIATMAGNKSAAGIGANCRWETCGDFLEIDRWSNVSRFLLRSADW